MFYRYELWIGDEFQEIGFLQGLDDTGLVPFRTNELVEAFEDLTIPPKEVFAAGRTRSWFTEEGQNRFESAIEAVIAAYEEDGLFDVERLEEEVLDGTVAYEDDYQVLVYE